MHVGTEFSRSISVAPTIFWVAAENVEDFVELQRLEMWTKTRQATPAGVDVKLFEGAKNMQPNMYIGGTGHWF